MLPLPPQEEQVLMLERSLAPEPSHRGQIMKFVKAISFSAPRTASSKGMVKFIRLLAPRKTASLPSVSKPKRESRIDPPPPPFSPKAPMNVRRASSMEEKPPGLKPPPPLPDPRRASAPYWSYIWRLFSSFKTS